MLLAWRGLARGKFLVMWVILGSLAGSAALLYGVYEDDAPLTEMNHRSVDRRLALSFDLARSLGMNGTPSFVIGDQVVRGFVPIDQLTGNVSEKRAEKANRQ